MITFFGILFTLLIINALFLIFSVNGVSDKFKKPSQHNVDAPVSKLLSSNFSKADYKEAV